MTPDPAKVAPAVSRLSEQFGPDDVKLYLNTLLCQDPEAWAPLRDLPLFEDESVGTAGSAGPAG